MYACRYGPPVFWTRDDAAGAWHPTVDYPPGAPPPPSPSLKAHPKAAPAAVPTLSADDPTDAATPTPLPNGHAANGSRTPTPLETEDEGEPLANGTAAAVAPGSAARESVPSAGATVSDTADMPVSGQGRTPGQGVLPSYFGCAFRGAPGQTVCTLCKAREEVVHVRVNGLATCPGAQAEDLDELLRCCLVLVDVDIPLVALSDGVHSRSFAGGPGSWERATGPTLHLLVTASWAPAVCVHT